MLPAWRWLPILGVVSAVLVAGAAPEGRVPPRPVEVSEATEAPAGEVAIEPAQVELMLEPATADLIHLQVVNGSEGQVSLDVQAVPVGADPDGAPVIPAGGAGDVAGGAVPSAAGWLALPDDEVHLGPSEAAAFRPAVTVPSGTEPGGYVAAFRFVGDGFQLAAILLVVVLDGPRVGGAGASGEGRPGGDPEVAVSVRRAGRTRAAAVVTLDAGSVGATDVTGALRVRAWYGPTLVATELPATVVLPDVPRRREVLFRAPVVPGPYAVSVEEVAGRDVRFGDASSRAWLWNPGAVIVAAVVLVGLSGWLVWRVARR